jgi:hypothetical protein
MKIHPLEIPPRNFSTMKTMTKKTMGNKETLLNGEGEEREIEKEIEREI